MSIILRSLPKIVRAARTSGKERGRASTAAVGFFDLTGSTPLKLRKGHTAGLAASLVFCAAASSVVAECKGQVVKRLGDGILCRFPDSLDGLRAAINLKKACRDLGLLATFGLTLGRIAEVTVSGANPDIYGAAVDRCSRIQSLAYPGQILIDEPLFEVLQSHLLDIKEVLVGTPFVVDPKGTAEIRLWEVSTRDMRLVSRMLTPFRVHSAGRLSIEEKIQFVNQAQVEVLEIGTGLTSFAKYFTGQKPKEFRNHIHDLLSRRVDVRCYAADPSYDGTKRIMREQGETRYAADAARAKEMILAQNRRFIAMNLPGRLEYYAYRLTPAFHAICVDPNDAVNARILFSPYLPGTARAECPVIQVSRLTHPELFEKYAAAVENLQRHARQVAP